MTASVRNVLIEKFSLSRSLFSRGRIAWYYLLVAASGALGLFKGLAYAKIFGTQGLGYYALAVSAVSYAEGLCHFGLYRGLDCVLPALYGAGQQTEAERLRNVVAGGILVITAGFLIVVAAVSFLLPVEYATTRAIIVPVGFLTSAIVLYGLAAQDLRSRTSTFRFGLVTLMRSALCLLIGGSAGWAYGYRGALVGEALAVFGLFIFTAKVWCRNFRFEIRSLDGVGAVAKLGYPLMAKTLASELLSNIDRWAIAVSFGVAAVGQYAFASIIITVGLLIHSAIFMHVGPHAAFAYGKSGDIRLLIRLLNRISIWIVLAFVVGWFPFLVLTRLVAPYFGEFDAGIALLPILYWGVLFQVLSQYEWIPMTLKKPGVLLSITVACGSITAVMYGVAILLKWPMSAFAWIFVAGRAMACAGQLGIALRAGRRLAPVSPEGALVAS